MSNKTPTPSPRRETSRSGAQNPLGLTFNLNSTKASTGTFRPISPGEGSITSEALPSFLLDGEAEDTPPSPALYSNPPSISGSMKEAIEMSYIYPSKSSYTSREGALSQPTDFTENMSTYMHEDFDVEAWRADRNNKKLENKSERKITPPARGSEDALRQYLKDYKLRHFKGPAPVTTTAPEPLVHTLNSSSIIESETPSQIESKASSRVSSRALSKASSKVLSKAESKASSHRSFSRSTKALSANLHEAQIQSFSRPPTPNVEVPTFDWLTQADFTQTSVSTQMLPTTEHVLNQLQDLQFQVEQYQSENVILKDETEAIRLEVTDLRKAKEALKSQVTALQSSLQISSKVVQETKDLASLERERYTREIAELKAALDASKSQNNTLQSENITLKTLQESTKNQRDSVLQQYNILKAQHDEVRAENKTLKNEAKLTKATSKEMSKSQKDLLEGKINTYKTKLSGAYTKISEFSSKIAKLEVTNVELGMKVQELNSKSIELESDNANIKNEFQNFKQTTTNVQTELEAGKTASITMKEAYDKLQKERNMFARILMHNWGINEAGLRKRADGIVGAGYKYRFINKDGQKEIKFLF